MNDLDIRAAVLEALPKSIWRLVGYARLFAEGLSLHKADLRVSSYFWFKASCAAFARIPEVCDSWALACLDACNDIHEPLNLIDRSEPPSIEEIQKSYGASFKNELISSFTKVFVALNEWAQTQKANLQADRLGKQTNFHKFIIPECSVDIVEGSAKVGALWRLNPSSQDLERDDRICAFLFLENAWNQDFFSRLKASGVCKSWPKRLLDDAEKSTQTYLSVNNLEYVDWSGDGSYDIHDDDFCLERCITEIATEMVAGFKKITNARSKKFCSKYKGQSFGRLKVSEDGLNLSDGTSKVHFTGEKQWKIVDLLIHAAKRALEGQGKGWVDLNNGFTLNDLGSRDSATKFKNSFIEKDKEKTGSRGRPRINRIRLKPDLLKT